MTPHRPSLIALLIVLATTPFVARSASSRPDFQRDVRPILARYCFNCHGPDEQARKAKLRLDERDGALTTLKSGGAAVVPRNPDASELVARIFTADADDVMPPPETKHALTDAQKRTLREWIVAGAEYTPHWAFERPVRPAVPRVQPPGSRIQNPIDAFVVARLGGANLSQSPPADDYTLVRRLYLDLIGLPPTPDEVDAFVQSAFRNRRSAIESLVDRLLASPHYGERWARKWLDLARYADTNGYEKDRERSIWPWRDWVIRALNADMPFDEFTIRQIAGDMLPGATVEDRIATGFHRNSMLNEEGGIDPLEFRFYALVDRVAVTGTTWLGLTTQCAQCHTHKFDPISHREYYSLMALLNNADEPDLELPPDLTVATQRSAILDRMERLSDALPSQWPVETVRWEIVRPIEVRTSQGSDATLQGDSRVLLGGTAPDRETITLEFEPGIESFDRIRIEALPDDSLPRKGPGRSPSGNFVLSEIRLAAGSIGNPGKPLEMKFASAAADFAQDRFPVGQAIDGDLKTGWAIANPGGDTNVRREAVLMLERPHAAKTSPRLRLTLECAHGKQLTLGSFRIALGRKISSAAPIAQRREAEFEKAFAQWLSAQRAEAIPWSPLKPITLNANLALLTPQADRSVFASGDQSKSDTYTLKYSVPAGTTALRLEALPDERLPVHGPGAVYYEGPKGDFFLSEFSAQAEGRPLKFSAATDSYGRAGIGKGTARAANCIDGDPQSGWSINGGQGRRHVAVFTLAEPITGSSEVEVRMLFEKHYAAPLGRFRISATTHAGGVTAQELGEEVEALLLKADDALTVGDRTTLRRKFALVAPELAPARAEINQLEKSLPELSTTLVMSERPPKNPRATFIHHRGEFLQPKEPVEPGVIEALHPLAEGAPRNRLSLARWLVSPENPLAARVVVNRAWQAFFGRGLVETVGDFGLQGELPSHPQLLDWLSVEFMERGWSQKRLHRLIVTSATYQQSSALLPDHPERDPLNVLLTRGARFRMDAELVRDTVLTASGLMTERIGGPSVYPPQPASVTSEGVYAAKGWPESKGEDRYRRGLYTFAKRSAPFAMFNTFDAPSGEACLARREVSNTPLQALTLLNDVVFIEAAKALGAEMAARTGPDDERVTVLFRRVLTRPPEPGERTALLAFLARQRGRLSAAELDAGKIAGEGDGDPNERAAWTLLARAVFNFDEAVTRE